MNAETSEGGERTRSGGLGYNSSARERGKSGNQSSTRPGPEIARIAFNGLQRYIPSELLTLHQVGDVDRHLVDLGGVEL